MLKDKSKEIDQNLEITAKHWYEHAKSIDESIAREQEILMSDAAKTDRSENAVYQIAADNYARLQMSKRDIENKIDAYKTYNAEYVPCEYVTLGTTVEIDLISENGNTPDAGIRTFYIKVVPAELGAARIGAISVNSSVGNAIKGKYKNDKFKIKSRKGEIEYLIKEVY